MDFSTIQYSIFPIRILFLAAAPLYLLAGVFLTYGYSAPQYHILKYVVVSCIQLSCAGLLFIDKLKKFKFLSLWLALLSNSMAVAVVLFQPLPYCTTPLYYLSVIIILSACAEVSLFFNRTFGYANLSALSIIGIVQLIRIHSIVDVSILVPIVLFGIWQNLLIFKLIGMLENVIMIKQFNAFKSTVIMLNHEFNNVNGICLGLIDRFEQEEKNISPQDLSMLKENLLRLTGLIQKITQKSTYSDTTYTSSGNSMVKLEE